MGTGIPYQIYAPSAGRKILEFKQGKKEGRESLKEQAISYASDYASISSDDEADAICIACAHIKSTLEGRK